MEQHNPNATNGADSHLNHGQFKSKKSKSLTNPYKPPSESNAYLYGANPLPYLDGSDDEDLNQTQKNKREGSSNKEL